MSVKKYSKAKDGNIKVGKFFAVKEFACRDLSDEILIDDVTVGYLDKLREHFDGPVTVTSGYRTSAYNAKINGAKNSYHVSGRAADIEVFKTHPKDVAAYAEGLGIPGIGLYDYGGGSGFVHIDNRSNKYYWLQTSKNGGAKEVSTHGGKAAALTHKTIREGSRGDDVAYLQSRLNRINYVCGASDGIFGVKTDAAVRRFQKERGLVIDGIAGVKTWKALEG